MKMKMKTKINHPTDRVLIFILLMIVAIQTALLGYLGQKTQILWEGVQGCASSQIQSAGCLSAFPALENVRDAINGLLPNQGVADTNGTKVYFPELKIYLPYSQTARNLRYGYQQKSIDNTETANFSTYNIMNNPIQSWNDIPCHQFLAGLSIDKTDDSNWQYPVQAGTVKLKDGRTLYIYKNKLQNCADKWGDNKPDKIVDILKQAQSY
jgi:hypothetical protein